MLFQPQALHYKLQPSLQGHMGCADKNWSLLWVIPPLAAYGVDLWFRWQSLSISIVMHAYEIWIAGVFHTVVYWQLPAMCPKVSDEVHFINWFCNKWRGEFSNRDFVKAKILTCNGRMRRQSCRTCQQGCGHSGSELLQHLSGRPILSQQPQSRSQLELQYRPPLAGHCLFECHHVKTSDKITLDEIKLQDAVLLALTTLGSWRQMVLIISDKKISHVKQGFPP